MISSSELAVAIPGHDLDLKSTVEIEALGLRPYDDVREIQERAISLRQHGRIPDTIFLCEHPPTLTLGKRSGEDDLTLSASEWETLGVAIRRVDRGGRATLHLPGQLVIYPVCSLRELKIGVRQFVTDILTALSTVALRYGVETEADLARPGLWCAKSDRVGDANRSFDARKLGFVGLRVMEGVTNHGFSLNVDCDLLPFSRFVGCGEASVSVSSLAQESVTSKAPTIPTVTEEAAAALRRLWIKWRNL